MSVFVHVGVNKMSRYRPKNLKKSPDRIIFRQSQDLVLQMKYQNFHAHPKSRKGRFHRVATQKNAFDKVSWSYYHRLWGFLKKKYESGERSLSKIYEVRIFLRTRNVISKCANVLLNCVVVTTKFRAGGGIIVQKSEEKLSRTF